MHRPLDENLIKIFNKVETGNRPQQKWLCAQLGVTEEEYTDWLKTLFILLMRPDENQPNLLEQMVKSMYEADSHIINVFVFYYDENFVERSILLSDRGFSIPAPDDEVMAYNFNLSSQAFITYAFQNVDNAAPVGTPQKIIDAYKSTKNSVSVRMEKNNLDALSVYNRHVVYQAFEHVYCSSNVIYGL